MAALSQSAALVAGVELHAPVQKPEEKAITEAGIPTGSRGASRRADVDPVKFVFLRLLSQCLIESEPLGSGLRQVALHFLCLEVHLAGCSVCKSQH